VFVNLDIIKIQPITVSHADQDAPPAPVQPTVLVVLPLLPQPTELEDVHAQ